MYLWAKAWADEHYPGWRRRVFFSLILSFLYLAFSGFFFALLIPRGLHGLPLLLHVAAGGIFAVCLSMVVTWRARDYTLDVEQPLLFKMIFWTFVVSGLGLTMTSLGSMISFLSMEFQIGMIRWHRFSGIVSLVCVSAFLYFSLNREE